MRRCYYCGIKKQDDDILCEKCAKEIEERIKKTKKQKIETEKGGTLDGRTHC